MFVLEENVQNILNTAISNFALSFRAINKVLKVARTIADIEGFDMIQKIIKLESLSYRKR